MVTVGLKVTRSLFFGFRFILGGASSIGAVSGSDSFSLGGASSIGAVSRGASMCGFDLFSTIVASCFNASDSLSVRGSSGEFAVGFWSALMMSFAAANIKSLDVAVGIEILFGYHFTVSVMRSDLVSSIQTL